MCASSTNRYTRNSHPNRAQTSARHQCLRLRPICRFRGMLRVSSGLTTLDGRIQPLLSPSGTTELAASPWFLHVVLTSHAYPSKRVSRYRCGFRCTPPLRGKACACSHFGRSIRLALSGRASARAREGVNGHARSSRRCYDCCFRNAGSCSPRLGSLPAHWVLGAGIVLGMRKFSWHSPTPVGKLGPTPDGGRRSNVGLDWMAACTALRCGAE